MNISIADDLRKRIKRASKLENVNWSAVASRAFAEQCSIIEARQKEIGDTMDEVVARMRGLEQTACTEAQKQGDLLGSEWAKKEAEPDQLRRLEAERDPNHDWYFGVGSSAYSDFEQFYFCIEPDNDGDRDKANEFWESALGDDYLQVHGPHESEFLTAFGIGALAVWAQVQDKL